MAELVRGLVETEMEHRTIRGTSAPRVEVIHARPTGMPVRGVVVHPDIFGNRPLFEDLADRLASHGAAVLVVEPFAALPADERDQMNLEARARAVSHLNDHELLGDLEAAATFLITEDDVADVAILGFCYGGHQALKAAATGDFDRVVSFYGMVHTPEFWQGPATIDPMSTISEACPILAILGDQDTFIPPADLAELCAALAPRHDSEVRVYPGAEHGFVHDPSRSTHRAEDAADAWSHVLAFLGLP